jgi:hypothetical protein
MGNRSAEVQGAAMRRWARLFLFVALLAAARPVYAQTPDSGVVYFGKRAFPVPFNISPGGQASLSSVQLFASNDFGRSWQAAATAAPDQGYFRYSTELDGTYWFAVQTTDKNGRVFPLTMDGATPNLKVVIDTTPPIVELRTLPPRGNDVGLAWQVRDETFSPSVAGSIILEFRSATTPGNWARVDVPTGVSQVYWNPGMAGPIDVRITARDQAGNQGGNTGRIGGSTDIPPVPAQTTPPVPPTNPNTRFAIDPAAGADRFAGIAHPPTPNELKLINSRRVSLDFDLKDKGPSGLSSIELWLSSDGRNWKRHGQVFQDDGTNKLTFDLDGEGLYGITLVAKSGVGLGDPPPQAGDRPQLWIEVDLTKPQVALKSAYVGKGIDKGKLRITWSAADRNLSPNGITLKYADQPTSPWRVIVDKAPNTGEYTWQMPTDVPYQFFLKVEAADRAGNVGEDVTAQPVRVDLSHPRAIPREISPAAN